MEAKNFHDGFAANFAIDREEVVKSLIHGLDAAIAIQEQEAFGHAVEEGLLLGFVAFGGEFFEIAKAQDFALLIFEPFLQGAITASAAPFKKNCQRREKKDESGPHVYTFAGTRMTRFPLSLRAASEEIRISSRRFLH
jgi:hypothetical protein